MSFSRLEKVQVRVLPLAKQKLTPTNYARVAQLADAQAAFAKSLSKH
jgi:hypothetical protein